AILAARSEVFERMIFTGTEVTGKQISFSEVEASSMKIILEYLYTGTVLERDITIDNALEVLHTADFFQLENFQDLSELYKKTCEKKEYGNKSPELLSKAVQLMSPLANNSVVDYLVDSVAKIPLDSIEIGRLSLQGLQCLLSKRNEARTSTSSEYSVLRFAILSAAKEVSEEAFSILNKRLPLWKKVKGSLQDIENNYLTENEIGTLIADAINPVIDYVNFRRIDGMILAKVIEPLDIIPINKITDSYRFQACKKYLSQEYYRTQIYDFKWDINGRGPNISISEDGYTISTTENMAAHQSVRTNYLMSNGIYEFHVLFEKVCLNSWVGVCDEDLDFSHFAGDQPNGWILGTNGCYYHNRQSIQGMSDFRKDNAKVI
ncbi:3341_t:CDS:1, partial [Acaulospora morrowiae]